MSDQNKEAKDILDDIIDANANAAVSDEQPQVQVEVAVEVATEEPVAEVTPTETPVDETVEDHNKPSFSQPNVHEYFSPLSDISKGSPDSIELPPDTHENVINNIRRAPNLDTGETENANRWHNVMQSALTYIPLGGMYNKHLNDPKAHWSQVVEYGGDRLYGSAPTNVNKPGVTEYEGERAILKLVTQLGIGGLHRTPLYNSGFWVYFKPASEAELLELNMISAQDKIALGRSSYGLAHSNHVSYTLSRVFELALRNVYDSSVKQSELPIGKLADHIAPQDIHAFIWGFLCANYPSGFHYERPCSSDPTKCTHVSKGNISIPKTLITDSSMLTDWQKNHMRSFASGSMTLIDVQRYRSELTHLHSRRVILNKGTEYELGVTLRTPTMRQYIDQGFKYVTTLVDSINRSMSIDASNDQRNLAIDQHSRAEKLCQWIHFIDSIEFGQLSDESNISAGKIKDFDTLRRTLATLSATDSISEEIIKEITSYVEDSTISIMAIPAYDCPVCGKPQETATAQHFPRMSAYIPLDILQVFFGLLARRVSRIMNR